MTMQLVWPAEQYLPEYVAALERGWSADNVRGRAAADEELAKITADRSGFVEGLVDREARGDRVTLPDGSSVARLPGYVRWLMNAARALANGRRALAGAALLLLMVSVIAAAAPPAHSAEQAVIAVTEQACDAFRRGDAAALEDLLAPQFTLLGTDGTVQPRAQAFAEVRAREPRYEVFRNHDMVAHVYGDAATVQGITSLKGTAGGKPFALDVRFTDTLVRVKGRWKIVVSHVTRLPAK